MDINVVILHKLIKMISRQMCAVIKTKGSPRNVRVCNFYFGEAVYNKSLVPLFRIKMV